MLIQKKAKLKYTGKLLFLRKNIQGVITPKDSTVINIEVEKGFYLITYDFIDDKSKNIFLDILVHNKIVLLRIKKSKHIEFLN